MYRQFARIFETFRITSKSEEADKEKPVEPVKEIDLKKVPKLDDDDDDNDDDLEV